VRDPSLIKPQSEAKKQHRQSEAMRTMIRRSRWVQPEIYEAFVKTAEAGTCPLLQVGQHNPAAEDSDNAESDDSDITKKKKFRIEKPTNLIIDNLETGMKITAPVYTKKRVMVLPHNKEISPNILRTLRELGRRGEITEVEVIDHRPPIEEPEEDSAAE
jgi:hypothetical protein